MATHAFDLVGIKRSWHSTEGGFVIVGVERVSDTNRYPTCTRTNSLKWLLSVAYFDVVGYLNSKDKDNVYLALHILFTS